MSYLLNVREKLKYFKDLADLVTTILIISGLSLTAVITIGGIAYATRDNAKQSADCIANYSALNDKTNINDDCKGTKDDGSEEENTDNQEIPEESEEEIIPTSDNCFLLNEIGDTIVKYKIELEECSTDVIIPESINNITIKHVGDYAFVNETPLTREDISFGITSVEFPNTIETIGLDAFTSNDITNITLPDSVTSISDYAFSDNEIVNLYIPDSVTNISTGVFYSNQLSSVIIPDSVTSIGSSAFSNNEIVNLYIPDSVESIGQRAFYNNPLQSLRITENPNYTTIENGTFYFFCGISGFCTGKPNTTNIDLLEIPNNIKTIEDWAFQNMQIRELTIPSSVEIIKDYAFERTGLERVNFNNGLISIGSHSFYGNNIEELVLPETLESIGWNAFEYNRNLLNNGLIIPYSVKEIETGAFTESGGDHMNPPIVMIPHHTNYYPDNGSNLKSFHESFITIVRY